MDDDTLVITSVTPTLVFDAEDGEHLHIEVDEDNPPTTIQALGMFALAADTFICGNGDDDD